MVLSITLAQIDTVVGDIDGNAARIIAARKEAHKSDLVVFGELSLAGYPPEDLVLKQSFQKRIKDRVKDLAEATLDDGPALLIGAPWRKDGKLFNAALLLDKGNITAVRCKHVLPNYGVFDEKRVFAAGPLPAPVDFCGLRLGVMICEDMWSNDVSAALCNQKADILVVLNGSPFETDKAGTRLSLARDRIKETELPLVYVNLVGGQDELVFDGASFVLDTHGLPVVQAPAWEEATTISLWQKEAPSGRWSCAEGSKAEIPCAEEAVYQAMMTGLRGYLDKKGFPGVVIGLSGGIDSALTAAVAVDALGAKRVHGVMMPSPYTSPESLEDAGAVADLLGFRLDEVAINSAMEAFEDMLEGMFKGAAPDVTEENIQARTRGIILMALSNKFGHMVLTTGNKSEMSVGYATLYGDMCGGFSVLKDIYKTDVFALSRWRNENKPLDALGPEGMVMPERVITKPPSAELRFDQTDQDSLPPYEELDAILKGLVEEELSVEDMVHRGFCETVVRRVWRLLDGAEYKRRQAPPGVKITSRAFGRDRRYPITNRFVDQT
jgi:NAD+ synthase